MLEVPGLNALFSDSIYFEPGDRWIYFQRSFHFIAVRAVVLLGATQQTISSACVATGSEEHLTAACGTGIEGDEGLSMVSGGTNGIPADVPTTPETEEPHGLARRTPAKEKKTAEELAAMIRQDLSKVDGCPERGISVTVYGLSPWNSLLAFGVDAGPVPNKADLQNFCDIITERLKRLYDVSVVEQP
jgi:hypothetical protein